jgi:hypothetical protein
LQYHANLGQYGTFELEIAADDSFMSWKSSLNNVDQLEQDLGGDIEISALAYHLHQQWTLVDADYAIGATACGSSSTGGHYDPFLGCGPATGVPADQCMAIGKSFDLYSCSPQVYESGAFSECEVGDLSAKYGPMQVLDEGVASASVGLDPFPALNAHYAAERTLAFSAAQFASIVFHNGSTRVLCGKLMEGKLPSGIDTTTAPTSSTRHILVGRIGTLGVVPVVLAILFQM